MQNSKLEPKVNYPIRGMALDTYDTLQKPDYYCYARGVAFDDFTGNSFKVSTENGNEISFSLPTGYTPIGHINLQRGKTIVFSVNEDSGPTEVSQIGLSNNNKYSVLINSTDLNFSTKRYIRGEFRTRNGCETIIYFNDYYNPDRVVNIDQLDTYTKTGYTVEQANALDQWDVNEMRLQPRFNVPYLNDATVLDAGGTLELGLYSFVVEILDEGRNSVGFGLESGQVQIYDDSIGQVENTIDGGRNIADYAATQGGVQLTNKSIRLEISNLDIRFPYYRLWVIRRTSGNGVTAEVFKKGTVETLSQTTDTYTFTGIIPEEGDIIATVDELVLEKLDYSISRYLTQVDRRLTRYNIKSNTRDYSGYQRIVNGITTSVVTRTFDPTDATAIGHPKNPNTYFGNLSNLGDEVYPYGIRFIHNDGVISPTFNIPGRSSTSFDTLLLTVVESVDTYNPLSTQVNLQSVKHLGFSSITDDIGYGVGKVPRWRVYNTARNTDEFAYHEAIAATYPTTLDCDGESIWGNLAGQKIRHHRFPSRSLIPHINDSGLIVQLGIQFANITYPSNDIVGHIFVRGERDAFNRTIIDKGYTVEVPDNINLEYEDSTLTGIKVSGLIGRAGTYSTTPYTHTFLPKAYYKDEFINGTHIFYESQVEQTDPSTVTLQERVNRTFPISGGTIGYFGNVHDFTKCNYHTGKQANRKITTSAFIAANSLNQPTTNFPSLLRNQDFLDRHFLTKIDGTLPDFNALNINNLPTDFHYVAYKTTNDVFTNLDNIKYVNTDSQFKTLTSSQVVYGGDIIIANNYLVHIYDSVSDGGSAEFQTFQASKGLYIESEVNSGMRHSTTSEDGQYWNDTIGVPEVYVNKTYSIDSSGNYVRRGTPYGTTYYYNPDYSNITTLKKSLQLPENYEYCNKCLNQYPNRIIWSEVSFQEEASDGYRTFLNENYTIVGENTGQITGAHYDKNRLLVRTEQSLFQLNPNPQTIQTDLNTAYLGTGDFLSIPPQELVKTDIGYAGGQGRYDFLSSPVGFVTVDGQDGKVFLNLKDITGQESRCERWFQENLPIKLLQQVPTYAITDSIINRNGVGIFVSYDPYHDSIIIHKKDYKLLNYSGLRKDQKFFITHNTYYDETVQRVFIYENGQAQPTYINLNNSQYVENLSFTVAYSLKTQSWRTFEPYLPSYIYFDYEHMYTIPNQSNQIWIHSPRNYGQYYGTKYEMIIELPIINPVTSDLDSVEWYTRAVVYDESNKQWKEVNDKSFTKMVAYTLQQTTGFQNLITYTSSSNHRPLAWNNTTQEVIYNDKNYRLSAIQDLSIDSPTMSSRWEDIQGSYPIDKIPFTTNIDYNRDQRDLVPLNDKTFKLRFYFVDLSQDTKLVVDIVNTIVNNNQL